MEDVPDSSEGLDLLLSHFQEDLKLLAAGVWER